MLIGCKPAINGLILQITSCLKVLCFVMGLQRCINYFSIYLYVLAIVDMNGHISNRFRKRQWKHLNVASIELFLEPVFS